MPYSVLALFSVIIFSCVHLWADKLHLINPVTHARLLSVCAGVSIAYVFVDILPKLCQNNILVQNSGLFPYIQRHVFVLALIGFLFFFCIDRANKFHPCKSYFWLSLWAFALFNYLVGYAVVDKDDPEVQPLGLFTIAMALHYFVIDYHMGENYRYQYKTYGKWILIASLFLGWLTGLWVTLSDTTVALVTAFIGGGIIMNVIRHELPDDKPHSLPAFILSTLAYTAILLLLSH